MPRVKRELARDVERTPLLAFGKIILDPGVLFDLTMENSLWRLHAVARKIFPFRHHTYTHHVVMLRDVPEPTLLRHERHGCRAFIESRITFRPFVVSPYCDLVEEGIFDAPLIAH